MKRGWKRGVWVGWMGVCLVLGISFKGYGEYQAKGKRDPFVPFLTDDGRRIQPPGTDEESEVPLEGLALKGIILGKGGESMAILNDRVVREGEEVDGFKVVKIGPQRVTILVDGKEMDLHIQKIEEETENR